MSRIAPSFVRRVGAGAVDVDRLECEPGVRALGEEAIEGAVCAVQRDGQAELVA